MSVKTLGYWVCITNMQKGNSFETGRTYWDACDFPLIVEARPSEKRKYHSRDLKFKRESTYSYSNPEVESMIHHGHT